MRLGDDGSLRGSAAGERSLEGFKLFDNGVLAPRDPRVLARAIRFLVTRPELRQAMGQTGRQFVAARYSCQRLADDLELLYRELVLAKNPGQRSIPEPARQGRPGAAPSRTGLL